MFNQVRNPNLIGLIRTITNGNGQNVISYKHLEEKLRRELSTTFLHLKDVSSCNCGQKFEALIVSPKFEGKSLLSQQRLVMNILKDEMKIIHSFTQKTLTPKQWNEQQHLEKSL